MEERRRYKRFAVDVIKIAGRAMFASEVKILDISTDGILLKADIRLDIGSQYMLRLQDYDKVISVKGVVESSSISETRMDPQCGIIPMYTASVKFLNASDSEMNELASFIEEYKKYSDDTAEDFQTEDSEDVWSKHRDR
jgi:hypothetical protein